MAKEKILSEIMQLNDSDLTCVLLSAFKVCSDRPDVQRAVAKFVHKHGSKNAAKGGYKRKGEGLGVDQEGTPASCPGPFSLASSCTAARMGQLRKEGGHGVDQEGTLASCPGPSSPNSFCIAASKVPFVYRGDLITDILFIDVEKISLKLTDSQNNHEEVAGCIAIVNEQRDLVYWAYMQWPLDSICQTFTSISGLTKDLLQIGLDPDIVRYTLHNMLKGITLVGYDMEDDLNSIGIYHEMKEDLAHYYVEHKRSSRGKRFTEKYSLKDTFKSLLNKEIQCSTHSAISDARATRDLFYKKQQLVQGGMTTFQGNVTRTPRAMYIHNVNDKCHCSNKKQKDNQPLQYPNM